MKELLKDVLQHCQEMQKMAETKNAGLIALNGAITLTVIKLLTDGNLNCYFQCYLFFVLACSLISIFLNLSSISAQLNHKEQDITNHKSINLLFFGTVANYSADEYLRQIKIEYEIKEEITKFHIDQAKQVVINAQIALRKFKIFNNAFKWTIAGVATPLSVVVYLLFFDNNK